MTNIFPIKSKEIKSLLEQHRQIKEENCDPLDLYILFALEIKPCSMRWYLLSLDGRSMDDMWAIRYDGEYERELVSVKLSSLLSMASTLGSTISSKHYAHGTGKIARKYLASSDLEDDDEEDFSLEIAKKYVTKKRNVRVLSKAIWALKPPDWLIEMGTTEGKKNPRKSETDRNKK